MWRLRRTSMTSGNCQNGSGIVKGSFPRPGMGSSVRSAQADLPPLVDCLRAYIPSRYPVTGSDSGLVRQPISASLNA